MAGGPCHTHPYDMRAMSGWNALLFFRNVLIKLYLFVVHYIEYWIVSNETNTRVCMYICFINSYVDVDTL